MRDIDTIMAYEAEQATTSAFAEYPPPPEGDIAIARLVLDDDEAFRMSRTLRTGPGGPVDCPQDPGGKTFVDKALTAELITLTKDGRLERSAAKERPRNGRQPHSAKDFFSGDWLEYAVYEILRVIKANEPRLVQEVMCDLQITPFVWGAPSGIFTTWQKSTNDQSPSLNQLDVVALVRERFVLFECKDRVLSTIESDAKRQIDKLALQRRLLGGTFAAAFLVTVQLVDPTSWQNESDGRKRQEAERDARHAAGRIRAYCEIMDVDLVELRPFTGGLAGIGRWEAAAARLQAKLKDAARAWQPDPRARP